MILETLAFITFSNYVKFSFPAGTGSLQDSALYGGTSSSGKRLHSGMFAGYTA
jgi:hypothetical protein